MSTRYLIAVAFMVGSACGAQAAVVGWNGGMHATVTKGAAAMPSHSQNASAAANSNADLAAALQEVKVVDHGKSGTDVVDGAPSGNFNNSGNGAVVITPAAGGQTGGAIVQLPTQAKNDTPPRGNALDQEPPVSLPGAPAAAAVPEPSSIALMMAGMLGALGVARRRKR